MYTYGWFIWYVVETQYYKAIILQLKINLKNPKPDIYSLLLS